MEQYEKTGGFTIIEVVLVLAIAGLIFLMVFVALPTMQRSQRDTQRKNDVGRVVTALTNWQADGNRSTGTPRCLLSSSATDTFAPNNVACRFLGNYLNDKISATTRDDFREKATFADPSGEKYGLVFRNNAAFSSNVDKMSGNLNGVDYSKFGNYTMVVTTGAKCNPNNSNTGGLETVTSNGSSIAYNFFAVRYRLEDNTIYCRDNSE